MKSKAILIISSIILVLAILATVLITQLDTNDVEPYSPTPVGPPPEDVSEPVENKKPENLDSLVLAKKAIIENLSNLEVGFASQVNEEFLDKMSQKFGYEAVENLATALESGVVSEKEFKTVIGYTEKAFLSILNDDLNRTTVLENTENGETELVFVGDTGFFDGYSVMNKYNSRGEGIKGLVSEEVIEIMRNATITMANNEFTFTTRGYPIPHKTWTFRGNPKNVSIYYELGVDIVGLANNHAYDYGPDSLTDTLKTLDDAGIARLGAGENLEEAKAPYFYIVNGYKIAIVAGSAIDPYSTRGATDSQSGVFQIFDTVSMSREISEAKEKADYVIAYVHWGIESTTNLTAGQKSMGKAFVDAGADVVVGMHSHCMQGLEYYKGKLIIYSLGNFVFSSHNLTCGMYKLTINEDGEMINVFYPMMQTSNFTYINSGEKGAQQLAQLRSLLINAEISDDYVVTEP